jgi:hypothetical protein
MNRPGFVSEANEQKIATLAKLISHRLDPRAIPREQWPSIVGLAEQHRLAPMLYWALKQTDSISIEKPIEEILTLSHLQTSVRWMILDHTRQQIETALSDQRIPTLWIKGAVLACTVYPKPSLRPMSDLDVLVPYQLREVALKTVQSLGYQFYGIRLVAQDNDLMLLDGHEYSLRGGPSDQVALGLHYQLGEYGALGDPKQLSWFWTQKKTTSCNGTPISTLKPEAHLLYMSAHALLHHGEALCKLYHFYDMHLLIINNAIDWSLVIKQAGVLGWTYAIARSLELILHFFDTPVPDSVLPQLRKRLFTRSDFLRASLVSGKGARWEQMQGRLSEYSYIGKARLLFKMLFPSRAFMRTRYHFPPSRPIWSLYLYRWFDQCRELCWWTWRYLKHRWAFRKISHTSSDIENLE